MSVYQSFKNFYDNEKNLFENILCIKNYFLYLHQKQNKRRNCGDHEWKGNGCVLRYVRDKSTEELGRFTLTVPSSLLEPGKSATLGVTAEAKGSRRWFAVMEP